MFWAGIVLALLVGFSSGIGCGNYTRDYSFIKGECIVSTRNMAGWEQRQVICKGVEDVR